jgi:hypothetical protein
MRVSSVGIAVLTCALVTLVSHGSWAQQPGSPPPGYGYPPPGYPQQGYYPPPGYQYGQPASPPPHLPYNEGQPIPAGYQIEETTRKGPIIAGALVLGIPYVIGLSLASASDFANNSGWLIVPALGPWMTLGTRDTSCDEEGFGEAVTCVVDIYVGAFLVLDGLAQAAGATLLVWGITSTKQRLVRSDLASLTLRPMRVGSGHGFGVSGAF